MAIVDADYKFIYIDVGTNGRISDGGVWNKTKLKRLKMALCHYPNLKHYLGKLKQFHMYWLQMKRLLCGNGS